MPHDQKTGGYANGSGTDLLTCYGGDDSVGGCLDSTILFGGGTIGSGVINVNPSVFTHRLFLHKVLFFNNNRIRIIAGYSYVTKNSGPNIHKIKGRGHP